MLREPQRAGWDLRESSQKSRAQHRIPTSCLCTDRRHSIDLQSIIPAQKGNRHTEGVYCNGILFNNLIFVQKELKLFTGGGVRPSPRHRTGIRHIPAPLLTC